MGKIEEIKNKIETLKPKNPSFITSEYLKEKDLLYNELGKAKMEQENAGLYASQNKDRRISFLSIFSSLCSLDRLSANPDELSDIAIKINTKLYKEYPFPNQKENDVPFK